MRIVTMVMLVGIIVLFYRQFSQSTHQVSPVSDSERKKNSENIPSVKLSPRDATNIAYEYQGINFDASLIEIKNPQHISIYVNKEKRTTNEFKKLHGCKAITSAGFYSTDDTPLGLFVSQGTMLHRYRPNLLLNGVFSIKDQIPTITKEPIAGATTALQSGPQLYNNGEPLPLAILNDEPARRIVILITADRRILLGAFYQSDDLYSGPLLGDLPHHIEVISSQTDRTITEALNLDGGTASAFDNGTVSLQELTTVGSFFCVVKG